VSFKKKKIFIVHGREKIHALELQLYLEKKYMIEPIILESKPHRGRTIIEKFEDYSDVDHAIIIMTPDDIGGLKGKRKLPRSRQNVILELGAFITKIGRNNIILVKKGKIELPSNIIGVGYYEFNKEIKEVYNDIENELIDAGLIKKRDY